MEDGNFAEDSDLVTSEIQAFLDMSGTLFMCIMCISYNKFKKFYQCNKIQSCDSSKINIKLLKIIIHYL